MEDGTGTVSRTAAVVLLFAVCAIGILLSLGMFWPELEEEHGIPPTLIRLGEGEANECGSGAREPCTEGEGCAGERVCMHGSWSGCFVYDECTPGEERFCAMGGCSSGVQTCNDCGQWGECGAGG
ncbi:hypothetical protein JW721_02765 [Candidatus Micrarchaeota archaeon]|nr:hypothetical protein [Candidatus Micrarchaeota archaeon]